MLSLALAESRYPTLHIIAKPQWTRKGTENHLKDKKKGK
jgi:hypothetical protein